VADEEADDTRENEGAKGEGEVIMAETGGEIEIDMGAAASNDKRSLAQLRQVLPGDHGGAEDRSETKSRYRNVAGAARGKRRNWNQPFSIRD